MSGRMRWWSARRSVMRSGFLKVRIRAEPRHSCESEVVSSDARPLLQFLSMRSSVLLLAIATMAAAPLDQKDIEYGRAGGKALLLDLHVPGGTGPFPAAILVHGGGFDEC